MSIKNLDELKAKINIIEIIKSYIPLKKVQGSFKALCPFHNEKTPSFVANEQKGFFYCFGCKEGGDAFSFVQKFKHYDFSEAVREIADLYNFDLEFSHEKSETKKDYFEFYERLNKHFKENLLKNEKLLSYLSKRGLDKDDLNRFDIGLVDENYALKEFIGKDLEMALKVGFLIKGQNGIYSQFAKRLSFALRNPIFKIVGFSCRIHPYENFSQNPAKYINSKESFLFHKSNFLYNLNYAKQAYFKRKQLENKEELNKNSQKQEKKSLVIVEGFMDSLALNKLGFKANVASCGTAFNQTHLATLLKADIENFALCFDKDEAGLKASLKTCELLFKHSFYESEILILKDNFKDISEFLENHIKNQNTQEPDKNSQEELKLENIFYKINSFEFYIREVLKQKSSAREKDKFIKALIKSINSQKNYYLKDFCFKILEKISGFDFKEQTRITYETLPFFNAEKTLFKSILVDEINKEIAFELLHSDFFESYKESFENFKEKGLIDKEANILMLDDRVQIVKNDDFNELCYNFKINFLKVELEKAKLAKNINLILSLQKQIKESLESKEVKDIF
ncbi:DNA primase [Campylobacter troglodytis]|uniref:DNA primase n=1 Tax=Campylobacter troglodytis TaxID=654363 RepID=UPI001157A9CF|nr:DNA primase [Campylobacter troglodytis]TQR53463.1 DNA primase [Campylobacter troglodytis]